MSFQFREPWHACDDEHFVTELLREVPEGHVLYGLVPRIVARRQDMDDFLFSLEDGRYANVHLTWSKESDPRWPSTEIYADDKEMMIEIQSHIDFWDEMENS